MIGIPAGIRRRLVPVLLVLAALGPGATKAAAGARTPAAVVEFFTSQGCSSCVPVLGLIGEIAKRPDVLVLSLHVDYWDYMGWKDPFALPAGTQRQRRYARQFATPYVYTPQIVVDGGADVPATDRKAVIAAIERPREPFPAPVSVEDRGPRGMVVRIGAGPFAGRATVWLALYDKERETRVLRGENADKTLIGTNIVRMLTPIGSWMGEPVEIPLSLAGMTAEEPDGYAVIVQGEDLGPILGAAVMDPAPDAAGAR